MAVVTEVVAVVNEVVALCSSILSVVSKIDSVQEDWFTASAEYKSEAEILRSRLTSIVEQIRIHQQPVDSAMMKILKRAESTLKRADGRLSSLEESVNSNQSCSQIWWLYAKVSLTLFPEKLESILTKVNQDLDGIPKALKDEQDLAGLLREADKNRGSSTVVHNNDNKYVPIEKSQSAVIEAIEDSDGPPMILLHGGLGKGKSTLARYLCERYGQFGERKGIFDHVIVVSCGNTSISDLATKQYEILELLSPTSITEASDSKPGENIGSKSRIAKALQNFFMGKKILMVLDDVSDKKFLYKMWEAARDGKDDKILITSQWSNLCDDFIDDSVLIAMEDPTKEEARQILSSLVGLRNNIIPENIQGIADEMIEITAGNPLALACLASNFAYAKYVKDKTKKRDWQAALRELSEVLNNEASAIVVGQNIETAPRSLWGAMKICIDSLKTEDAKRTLFLIYACKGQSVPEEVLRILCAGMKISNSAFKNSKEELCMRELLKPTTDTLITTYMDMEANDEECPAWSLPTLVRLYLEKHVIGKQDMSAVIGALIGDDELPATSSTKGHDWEPEIVEIDTMTDTEIAESEERKVTTVLCALYFDQQHTDQGVTRAVTKASKISNLEDSPINDLRRKAIEPLIWLLDKPEGDENWTPTGKCLVRKVLLDYICRRQLDIENITYLLKLAACPSAQLATLRAIFYITSIEERPLLNENTVGFVTVVLHIMNLKEGFHTSLQETASAALWGICWKASYDKSAILVTSMSGVLDVLVQSLAIPAWKSEVAFALNGANAIMSLARSEAFAQNAANAITSLERSEAQENHQIIVSKHGLLPALVNCLLKHENILVQIAAAQALANLASSTDVSLKFRIGNEQGALTGLVNCLSKHDNSVLQTAAAVALQNLASSIDESLKLRIGNEQGALVGLVNCLSKHDNSELLTAAASALANLLSSLDMSLKWRVGNEQGAVAGLVFCLSKQDNKVLQTAAAAALQNLATSIDESLKLRIANERGALAGLVNCLSKHENSQLQTAGASAIANLASSIDISLKWKIGNEQGALAGLVICLSEHHNNVLQRAAATALARLAGSIDVSLNLRIGNEEGALAGLVNCLSKHDNSEVQREVQTAAAGALQNLANSMDVSLNLRIANEEGALAGLVHCLSKHDNSELQTAAAGALQNLAGTTDESLKSRIGNEQGLLAGLVNCLSKHGNPELETAAAEALQSLAGTRDESLKSRIGNEQGLLASLVNCLSKHDNSELEMAAAGALQNLASSKDVRLKLRIANEKRSLVGLVNWFSR